ncbi:MAG TPA: hypothetical protein VMW17_00470 [Candidatus Binatia bacterium]|nr:hypothetical protein [Candidatus Binatia bacterium]
MKTHLYALSVGLALWSVEALAGPDPFSGFISPVSNPVNFEDPRATTEVRPIYAYHHIAQDFATNGGDAHVVALQLRLALTDRIAFIATKDGYTWIRPGAKGADPVEGYGDLAFGFKGVLYRDAAQRTMATFGFRYEAPSGNKEVFQGQGRGQLNPFLSGLWGTDRLHLLAYTGPRISIDGDDSSYWDTSVHADYRFENFFPLLEVNWIQVTQSGRRLAINQEGFDYFNLGATGAKGTGVVTMAMGGRWRVFDDVKVFGDRLGAVDFGTAYEFPLSSRKDLFDWRITTDLIFHLEPGALFSF